MWERGLKRPTGMSVDVPKVSLPMWERGLKHADTHNLLINLKSLPMWERGLKQPLRNYIGVPITVAPHVGAWIETNNYCTFAPKNKVAPHVGAWIETSLNLSMSSCMSVAPHVGAWIETSASGFTSTSLLTSLPMWERGLKHNPLACESRRDCRSPCGSVD